jgi:hypothetical protein
VRGRLRVSAFGRGDRAPPDGDLADASGGAGAPRARPVPALARALAWRVAARHSFPRLCGMRGSAHRAGVGGPRPRTNGPAPPRGNAPHAPWNLVGFRVCGDWFWCGYATGGRCASASPFQAAIVAFLARGYAKQKLNEL